MELIRPARASFTKRPSFRASAMEKEKTFWAEADKVPVDPDTTFRSSPFSKNEEASKSMMREEGCGGGVGIRRVSVVSCLLKLDIPRMEMKVDSGLPTRLLLPSFQRRRFDVNRWCDTTNGGYAYRPKSDLSLSHFDFFGRLRLSYRGAHIP